MPEQVREGYLTLRWSEVPDAARYRVRDAEGSVHYRGVLPTAFVSGLTDGTHAFTVEAIDAQGQILGRSAAPAVVRVSHWPLFRTMLLFAVGLVVVFSILVVLVWGAFGAQAAPASRSRGEGASESSTSGHRSRDHGPYSVTIREDSS